MEREENEVKNVFKKKIASGALIKKRELKTRQITHALKNPNIPIIRRASTIIAKPQAMEKINSSRLPFFLKPANLRNFNPGQATMKKKTINNKVLVRIFTIYRFQTLQVISICFIDYEHCKSEINKKKSNFFTVRQTQYK